ncbi:MAG: CehA/McbA family metallohydrolase [Acidobacteriota bacterium]|jgi:hypothetical protein
MTRARKLLLSLIILAVAAAAWMVVRVARYAPAAAPEVRADRLGYPWRGAFHVHSTASDGSGTVDEIMAAAARAELDFVVLTDHNVRAAERPASAWYGDVLLITAEEISIEEGHLLALQVPPHRYRFGPTARQALADIRREGGWALIAHADHAWQQWRGGQAGTEGLEVVNLAAAWSRQGGVSRALTVGESLIGGDVAGLRLLRYRWPMLQWWDARTALRNDAGLLPRRLVAIAAADAHGPFVGPVPSYADTLGALATLVFNDRSPEQERATGDVATIERKLMEALRAGRAAIVTTALGDVATFSFTADSALGSARMGDTAAFEAGPWRLRVQFDAGEPGEIVLLRDGEVVQRAAGSKLEAVADTPGTYRVEVYREAVGGRAVGGPPWLVSNPIYVWPAAARAAARVRPVPPLPAPPVTRDLLAAARFEANERGVVANVVEGVDMPRWRFEMARPNTFDAFAAMAWRPGSPLDWSAADGVVIELRARRPLRVNLEVRARAAGGQTESWTHSVLALPDSRAVAIPWSGFREPWSEDLSAERVAEPRRPTAADLTRVNGVFLVVTPLLLQDGETGELELRRLGLYGER